MEFEAASLRRQVNESVREASLLTARRIKLEGQVGEAVVEMERMEMERSENEALAQEASAAIHSLQSELEQTHLSIQVEGPRVRVVWSGQLDGCGWREGGWEGWRQSSASAPHAHALHYETSKPID